MESLSSTSIMSGNHIHLLRETEIIASEDHISELPEEAIQHIFSYLNLKELVSNSLVSRRWHRLSSDPYLRNEFVKKTFPLLSIFDASDWEKHFALKLEDEPPINYRTLFPILKQFFSLPIEKLTEENEGERIGKDAGVTLLTIPKGLTLKKLIGMAKDEDKVKFRSISDAVLEEIGDIKIDATYRILITNNVLEGSRGKSVAEQKDLVEKTFGYERPNALAMLALIVTAFISSGKRLYSDNPWIYARGPDLVDEYPVVVGAFGSDGLDVDFDFSCGRDYYGAACALRKF